MDQLSIFLVEIYLDVYRHALDLNEVSIERFLKVRFPNLFSSFA